MTARRPFQAAGMLLRSLPWLVGLTTVLSGTVVAAFAVNTAPVAVLLPTYLCGLTLVIIVGVAGFGERVTAREGRVLALLFGSLAVVAVPVAVGFDPVASRGSSAPPSPAAWSFAVAVLLSILLPLWLFCMRDRKVEGRHARRITGVAYGIGSGVLLGTAEVMGIGMIPHIPNDLAGLMRTPYPYLFLLAGALGLGLLHIGLQERRLIIVVAVMNVVGKVHLIATAALLFGEPWPADPVWLALLVGGMFLALYAVLLLPRHEGSRAAAPAPSPWPRGNDVSAPGLSSAAVSRQR
ncbi:hypothetical protein LO762_27220 [Actinocorallia sp. API 0066]|uniref:hypothetical protein n=1 Tax=Actinocorallia sp. API 0066 TaxID=2896846 RepID=UPI001E39E0B4|nr:hypothetical protein [Actinocorallia sp. API 0066]MCD0452845.1 hypothetical protein [Actinocorallia sp. API 0066]